MPYSEHTMIHMLPSTATYRKVRAGRSVHLLHGLLAYRTYNPPELLYTQFTLCMSVHCCLMCESRGHIRSAVRPWPRAPLTVRRVARVRALSASAWPLFGVPPAADPLVRQLLGLKIIWEYELTLCVFILTFFTQQAYGHWRSVYFTTRAIQGRINDACMLVVIGRP